MDLVGIGVLPGRSAHPLMGDGNIAEHDGYVPHDPEHQQYDACRLR